MPNRAFFFVSMILLVLAIAPVVSDWQRKRRLARTQSNWGQPIDRDRKMDTIAEYHRSQIAAEENGFLDDRTWEDLNLDAVFRDLDRTETSLGRQALYQRLRTVPLGANLEAFEMLVMRMADDVDSRKRAQKTLARLRGPGSSEIWWLTRPDALQPRAWHVIYPGLAALMVGLLLASAVWPAALLLLAAVAIANLIIRGVTSREVAWLLPPFRQVSRLIGVAASLQWLSGDAIAPLVQALQKDVPRLARLRKIARWISRDFLSMNDIAGTVVEYINILFLLDLNALYFARNELRNCGPALLRVLAAVGDVDSAISVASYRAGTNGWTRPQFLPPGTRAVLNGIRHPLIESAVPNSIELGPPYGVLITGSNMSGKTTFLRTVGVNVVLAQTINTCLATSWRAPVLHPGSCIGRSDDLLSGKSYYMAEVEAVLKRVRESQTADAHLFLFDELFRGTNAVERIASAEAVLTELAKDKCHFVLAATHDGELVDLLSDFYAAYHFEENIGSDGLRFEYQLRPGPTTSRNAIALLRLQGAPESLVALALKRAAVLDGQRRRTLAHED